MQQASSLQTSMLPIPSDIHAVPRVTLYQLDAVEMLRRTESGSIDLIVTDPAYESLEKHRKVGTTTRLKESAGSSNKWFDIFRNERYPEFFKEAYRVLAKNSHMYVMCDEETLFVIKSIAEAAGFKFWKSIIWDKQAIGMGYHYRNKTERIAFFEKGKRKLNDRGISDIISVKRIRNGYPTEKPTEIFDILIQQSTSPGETVLDPFFGGGPVIESAINNNRFAIGTDISEAAHDYTNNRLKTVFGE